MNGYILHFAVYTFAMIGFIAMALVIYKKSMYCSNTSKQKEMLNVENVLKLSATKILYVIKAGEERFLIAGDSANTTMLSKLEHYNPIHQNNVENITEIKSLKMINRG